MPHTSPTTRGGQPGNARRRRRRGCGSFRGHRAHAPPPPVAPPYSRFSASPVGQATLLPWLAPAAASTAPYTWPGHAGGGGECSASKQRTCSSARAARGEVQHQAWGGVPRLVASRRGAPCWPKFGESAGGGFRERARVDGRSYVHDEGSGATLQARGQVTGTRGSHNDPALASWSLNCTF